MAHAYGLTKQCNRRLPGVVSTVGLAQSLTLRFYYLRHMQGATVCYLTEFYSGECFCCSWFVSTGFAAPL
jgi:hypothetical protein